MAVSVEPGYFACSAFQIGHEPPGVIRVGREDRDPVPSRDVVLNARALAKPAGPARRPAGEAEPSWGRVLANTVKLAVARGLRPGGPRRRASGSRRWPARRWWGLAALVLAVTGAAVAVVWPAGGLAGAPSPAARVP